MSAWLELVNNLKQRPVEEYLTPTQRQARDLICEIMQFPGWLNLYGGHGTGKTFLAWAVSRATGAAHITTPRQLFNLEGEWDALIIDNAPYREDDVRRILARCDLLGTSTVMLVTRTRVALPMKNVHLNAPTPEEVALVIKALARLGYSSSQQLLPENANLWDILLACVV